MMVIEEFQVSGMIRVWFLGTSDAQNETDLKENNDNNMKPIEKQILYDWIDSPVQLLVQICPNH